jgi:hypothetical protein
MAATNTPTDLPADLVIPDDPRLIYELKEEAETDAAFARRLGKWFRTYKKKDARKKEVRENPENFTSGNLVRRKRNWSKKKNYSVVETFDDGHTETREYSSLAELAREKNLSHDSLRHMVANDRAGQQIKSNRYRRFAITKIGALAAKATRPTTDETEATAQNNPSAA